ncbi:MAG: hypothetical protein IIA14_08675 [SAR324 cluster bacterium]|nr:hypothetical protein [SAR324 cluster bacterium]
MPTRIKPVALGQGQDEEVNGILQFSKDGFQDTEMFGLIARVPALLKAVGPMFSATLAGGGLLPASLHEMMRLKAGEMNSCAY